MHHEQYRDREIRAKTRQVAEYHYDDQTPGKPLHLLVPGGLFALASLALIVLTVYRVWFEGSLDESRGTSLLLLLVPIYIGAVFLFSYGYELYDVPRALRLTGIIVFFTVAAVVIVAALAVLAGGAASSSSSRSRSRSDSDNSSRPSKSTRSSSWGSGDLGPVIFTSGPGTQTVTREVIREVPAEPVQPQPIVCPNCGRSYIAAEHEYVCPSCGAPSPAESNL